MELGSLVSLSGESGARSVMMMDDPYGYEDRRYLQRLMGRSQDGMFGEEDGAGEAVGREPGSLMFGFGVRAVLALKPQR